MAFSDASSDLASRSRARSDRGTQVMVMGATASAAGAIVFQLIGIQVLGDVDFAPIALLWTMQFLGFTILYTPVEQLIIRRLTLAGGSTHSLRAARFAIAGLIATGMAFGAGFVALNLDRSFQGNGVFVLIAAIQFLILGIFATGRGMLAGQLRFRDYGIAVGAESLGRIVLAVIVLSVTATTVSLAWALIVAPIVVLALRPFRTADTTGGDSYADRSSAGGFLTGMLVTTTASQTILAAGPLVVDLLGAEPAAVSTFFITFTLIRGPLTASYNVLARVLPWFTRSAAEGDDARLRTWSFWLGLGGVATGVVAAAGAAVIGPWLIELVFDVRPSGGLAALAAGGVMMGAVALFLGQVLVGRGATGMLAAVWVTALVLAALTLGLVDASPSIRTGWAFVVGEAAALVGTVGVVMQSRAKAFNQVGS